MDLSSALHESRFLSALSAPLQPQSAFLQSTLFCAPHSITFALLSYFLQQLLCRGLPFSSLLQLVHLLFWLLFWLPTP